VLTRPRPAASIVSIAAAAAVSALLAGCVTRTLATPTVPFRPPRTATLEEVAAAYDGLCQGLSTLSASGDLDVRDLRAGKARRLGIRVLAGRGGRLYLKGSVAVVTALEVVADGQRFWFRLPTKKTIWTGEAGAEVDEAAESDQAPYYALRPADLVEALLPEPLRTEPGDAVVLDGDREVVGLSVARLVEGRGAARRRILLERETMQLQTVRSYDADGGLLREVRYRDWREGSARRVLVSRPREGYEAEFVLDKVERNVTLPARAFSERPAEGYAVVEVGRKG
jgi:hypothetical protein